MYGPGGPDPVLGARALAAFNLQTRAAGAPSVRHVETALGDLPQFEVRGGQVRDCPGSPVTLGAFQESLTEAFGHVQYVRLDAAHSTLERLDGLLPCLSDVLSRDELARIAFLEGVALAYDGRDDDARDTFRRALVVAPELPWETRFPPGPESLFREAASEALSTASAPLTVSGAVLLEVSLWLDGAPVGQGGETQLAVGRHLLQWRLADGEFGTRVLQVGPDDELAVRGRADVARAAIQGLGDDDQLTRAAEVLTRAARGEGVDEVWLVQLGEPGEVDLVHRFDVEEQRWELADEGSVARRVRAHELRRGGRITGLVGGLTAAAGAVIGTLGHVRATELLSVADTHQSPGEYSNAERQYSLARGQAIAGWTLFGLGSAAAVTGAVLTARGNRAGEVGSQGEPAVEIGLLVSPGALGLRGTFR